MSSAFPSSALGQADFLGRCKVRRRDTYFDVLAETRVLGRVPCLRGLGERVSHSLHLE